MEIDEAVQSPPTVRSIERAFEILRILRESSVPVRLSDVARESGNHLATTQRIINVLVRSGYVVHEGGGYSMGVASLLNAHTFLVSNSLIRIALPVVQELVATTGFTASLSVRVEMKQILLLRIEGPTPLRYQLPVGEPMPLHLGGARVLAAALEPRELEVLLRDITTIRLADGQTLTHEQFVESLRIIREQGHVYGYSQREFGAASVAAPVRGSDDRVIASLQVSGLAEDFDEAKMDWCVAELKRASAGINKRLP